MAYEAEAGNISIALVGDSMINRKMTGFREPEYLEMVDMLQSADLSLTNLETQIKEPNMLACVAKVFPLSVEWKSPPPSAETYSSPSRSGLARNRSRRPVGKPVAAGPKLTPESVLTYTAPLPESIP